MNQRTRSRLRGLVLILTAAALVAASCGSDDAAEPTPATSAADETVSGTAEPDVAEADDPEMDEPEAEATESDDGESDAAESEVAEADEPQTDEPQADVAEGDSAEEEPDAASVEPDDQEPISIGMMVLVRVPALERVQGAIVATLAENGFVDGENITINSASADGDIATLSTIAQQFVNDEVDLIITTTTPALQAAFNASKDLPTPIPIVFSTVTDPVGAGVVEDLVDHAEWISGSQLLPPLEATFDVMFEVLPDMERIGYLYNPAEANSVIQTEWIKEIAAERGVELEIAVVSNSSEVKTAAEAVAGSDIDFFFYSQDSTVAQGVTALVAVANETGIPTITNDVGNLALGIPLGVGASLAADGRRAGEIASGFLAGELDLASTPIVPVEAVDFFVNLDAAAALGFDVPESYSGRAIPISSS
ncbi:MAG: hypothetical protein F4046_04475 [Acidimicrobiaceae bacterium]|nr:hypothetical protein [Acidimicrobiaceae bacterium]